ncbi:MAG: glycosyltransferase family 4 protein [Chitinophagaceae bacterium]
MHIILANRWYPPQANGGVATYNYNLARALITLGHQVTVVTARLSAQEPVVNTEEGVTVHRLLTQQLPYLHHIPLLRRYLRTFQQMHYSVQVARHLQKLQLNNPPDIIEFAEVNAEGWAYLRRQQRCPAVIRCHTPTFVLRDYYTASEMTYDTALTTQLEKFCIYHANARTVPSQDMAQTLARYLNTSVDQFAVIPNPVDMTQTLTYDKENVEAGERIVLHVGRLDRTKGIEVLAQAIPSIVHRFPDVRFVYVGIDRPTGNGNTWQQHLQAFFAQSGVAANVIFTGSINQSELSNWYRRATIAVIPSLLYESFSYTCAEAMAWGLPVIASRIGGISETVDHDTTGILVKPGDVAEFSEAIIRLLENSELCQRMGYAGWQKVQRNFLSEQIARQMLGIYQQTAHTGFFNKHT